MNNTFIGITCTFSVSGPFSLAANADDSGIDGADNFEDGATRFYLTQESRVSVYSLRPTCQTSFINVDKNQFYVVMQVNLNSK